MSTSLVAATGGLDETGSASLKKSLRKAERRKRHAAFLLTAPLLGYLGVLFFVPMAGMLWLSVANSEIPDYMPQTVAALAHWQPSALPPEAAYAAVAGDLTTAFKKHTFGRIAKRLNEEVPGTFGLINKTTFRISHLKPPASWKAELEKIDPAWSQSTGVAPSAAGKLTPDR